VLFSGIKSLRFDFNHLYKLRVENRLYSAENDASSTIIARPVSLNQFPYEQRTVLVTTHGGTGLLGLDFRPLFDLVALLFALC
jgi:hypothetical protein